MKKLFNQYKGLSRELYVLFFCELIDRAGSMVGPLLTLILSSKLGMDAGGVAAYFLVYTLLSLPIRLLGGRLTDRINKKLLINICDISTSIIYVICGAAGLSRTTLAFYMLGSLLQTAENPAYKSLAADFSAPEDRDRAYSLIYLGMNIGFVLAPTLGGLLIKEHLGLMFILSGVFQLLSILVFDIFIKDTAPVLSPERSYETKVEGKSAFRILLEARVLLPFLAVFSASMLMYNMFGYLVPLSLTEVYGESGSLIYGTISSLNGVTVLVFTAVLTALFAKRTTVERMTAGNLFELAGLALLFVFLRRPWVCYLAMIIFTFGEILNTVTTTPHLTRRIPANYRGRIMAVSRVCEDLVTAAEKLGLGRLYDEVSPNAAWIAVLVLGAATVAGYIFLGRADRKAYPELYE